jgi:hypothetical protein
MHIYQVEARIVTDLLPKNLEFVDFVMERSKPLLLQHEQRHIFYISMLFRCTRAGRVNVSMFFHDLELDYMYKADKELEPPCTLQVPLYFEYPFKVDHPAMVVVTVTEVGMIRFSTFDS